MELQEEAAILAPIFNDWYNLVLEKKLPEYDFGGLYILSYLTLRRPRKWSNGKFKTPITSECYFSTKLTNIPHILDLLSDQYLGKLFGINYGDISVVQIFATVRFTGIKKNIDDFVNVSIVNWALNRRPYILMTDIPTPLQVLRMQSSGQRVATAFLTEKELSSHHIAKLHYMEGHQNHSKDAFEFFIHDLKHMENFVDPNIYQEQIGFFYSFLTMNGNEISPKKLIKSILYTQSRNMVSIVDSYLPSLSCQFEVIFKHRFQQLWNELEYLISDMNCYLPHLVKYYVAKLSLNCHLLYEALWTDVSTSVLPCQNFPNIILSFDCYMRNIWIQLINLLQISLSPSLEDSSPFGACLSIINHSLQHSPSVNLPQLLVDNGVECCCLCEECSRYQTFQYSLQEEGEILRTHFGQIVGKNQELLTDVPTNVN